MLLYYLANFWHSSYTKDLIVRITVAVSLVFNVLMWLLLYVQIAPVAQETNFGTIPLHYNLYFGIDVFGQWYSVFAMPVIGLMVLLVNGYIGYLLYQKERVLTYFLVVISAVVNVITFAASVFVVLLNI